MYWADELVSQIPHQESKHRVDDMKTVSGMPHVGSLRAIVTHDILYKAMQTAGFSHVDFTYIFNDMDPMDSLPVYLDAAVYRPHMGKPLYRIPSPVAGFTSFGEYYALKYQEAFNKIGCYPRVIWSHELYASGQMDALVRVALDHADKIREIYKTVAGYDKPQNWLPYQVICPHCGKIGTSLVTDWDGTLVTYECKRNLVEWAEGCGHQGKIKPIGENGKLMWKVDWPAHWKTLNITVECAGKDHFSEGGSRDIGVHICREVFKATPPIGWLHEFFLIGGHKMSSSKGAGIGADKITAIIPSELVRFLITRTPIRRAVNFDPHGMSIPDLYDAYDETAQAYWDKTSLTSKVDKKTSEVSKLSRIFELSQIKEKPSQKHFLPRFRDVAAFIQYPEINIDQKFTEIKGSSLTSEEKSTLKQRIKYARIWLKSYAPKDAVFSITEAIPHLAKNFTLEQKDYLAKINKLLDKKWPEPEQLQQVLYQTAKDMNLKPKSAFVAIYLSLIGKDHGPRAAWLLLEYKTRAQKRFSQISVHKS